MPQEVKQKKKPRHDGVVGRDCRKPFDGSLVPKINDAFGVSRRRMANGTKAHRTGRLPSRFVPKDYGRYGEIPAEVLLVRPPCDQRTGHYSIGRRHEKLVHKLRLASKPLLVAL